MFRMLEPHSLQSRSAANCPEGSNYSPLKRRVVHGILGIQFLCGKTLHVNNETNSYRISDDSGQSVPATNKLELLITSNEQVARSINTVHKLSRIPGALTSKKSAGTVPGAIDLQALYIEYELTLTPPHTPKGKKRRFPSRG